MMFGFNAMQILHLEQGQNLTAIFTTMDGNVPNSNTLLSDSLIISEFWIIVTISRSLSAMSIASSRGGGVHRTPSRLSLVSRPPSSLVLGTFKGVPELSTFGIDLDAPVFWNSPYGKGGLQTHHGSHSNKGSRLSRSKKKKQGKLAAAADNHLQVWT